MPLPAFRFPLREPERGKKRCESGVVALAAAGLGEATGNHVADGEVDEVAHGGGGAEGVRIAALAAVVEVSGDDYCEHHRYEGEELGGLERALRLGGQPPLRLVDA